jgi:uncharacterized protein (DUF1800 family)
MPGVDRRIPQDRAAVVHALNRLGYGHRPGDVERIRLSGLARYIEEQLAPHSIEDLAVDRLLRELPSTDMSQIELLTVYPPPRLVRALDRRSGGQGGMDAARGVGRVVAELGQAKLIRAIHSQRQLEQVMVDFWFNHFNVFIGKGADRWLTTSYERDAIRPRALGRFRDLLGAVAAHPAMLFYLDNWTSTAPGVVFDRRIKRAEQKRRGFSPQRRGLNENYARELLELHTLGVDGGYTQHDVVEVARCFTGWTLLPLHAGQGFIYIDRLHDKGQKTVLGRTIKAGGVRQGHAVLDLLAAHPETARFVSTKLARRFVGDDPPTSLIDAMAVTFRQTDGDITEVLRTLFYSEQFWAAEYRWAKVKTPFELVVSAIRVTDAELGSSPTRPVDETGDAATMTRTRGRARDRRPGLLSVLRRMGQAPYGAQPPTGYDDRAEAWVSAGTLLDRMKFALGLAGDRIPGLRYIPSRSIDPSRPLEQSLAGLGLDLLGRQPTPATLAVLTDAFEDLPPAALHSAEGRTRFGTGWLLASAEFQRR